MVTQSTIFSIINFDYQVVIINITIISYEHNDVSLLRLYLENGGGRAPTTVRLPAGHGGGGDSSPELLVDGEGGENRLSGGVFLTRWGYGGRWRSCDGEEGGGGELDAPRTKNGERRARATLTVDECRDGGDGRTTMSFRHGRRHGF
jgi:hypothetical protein